MDGRITGMMHDLDQNKNERQSMEEKLQGLESERNNLEMERTSKKLLDPDQEERVKELDVEILKLK